MARDRISRLNRIEDKVGKISRSKARAQGAIGQHLKQLKKDFDCGNLEEAEQLLDRLEKQEGRLQSEFDQLLDEFETKWEGRINE